jgi:hypothetical protein
MLNSGIRYLLIFEKQYITVKYIKTSSILYIITHIKSLEIVSLNKVETICNKILFIMIDLLLKYKDLQNTK